MRLALCAVAAVLPGVFLSAASAQVPGGSTACRPDAQKYCASALGGGRDRMLDCLIDNQQKISDACYSFLKTELEHERDQRRSERQEAAPPAAAVSHPIYKVRDADGRTVYTNAPQANAVRTEEVAQDRVISAMPIRSSAR